VRLQWLYKEKWWISSVRRAKVSIFWSLPMSSSSNGSSPCKRKVEGKIVGSSCILLIKKYLVLGTRIKLTFISSCCELLCMYVCMCVVYILFSLLSLLGMP
jgi:hypothetical protein